MGQFITNKLLLFLTIAIYVTLEILVPSLARASACCVSAAAFGVGRLFPHERLAIGFSSRTAYTLGGWDPGGTWSTWDGDYGEVAWRTELWSMVAIAPEELSLFVRVPFLVNYRYTASLSGTAGAPADISLGLRWDIIPVGHQGASPGVALTGSLLVPTGRPPQQAREILAQDVTGRGSWAPSLALTLEEVWFPVFVRGELGVTLPLPFERSDTKRTQRLGLATFAAISAGAQLTNDFVLSGTLSWNHESPLRIDDRPVDDSSIDRIAIQLAVAWRITRQWTVQASIDAPLAFSHLGQNSLGELGGSIGARWGFF